MYRSYFTSCIRQLCYANSPEAHEANRLAARRTKSVARPRKEQRLSTTPPFADWLEWRGELGPASAIKDLVPQEEAHRAIGRQFTTFNIGNYYGPAFAALTFSRVYRTKGWQDTESIR